MVRRVGLDHHIPRKIPAARTARRLGQEFKGPLRALKIRRIEGEVRRHDTHKRHIFEIVSLYDHLGPDQDVRAPLREGGEDLLMSPFFCSRVRVHPKHAGSRELPLCELFQLLSPGPERRDKRGSAGRASIRERALKSAVVTL